jgi:hypothetical protein
MHRPSRPPKKVTSTNKGTVAAQIISLTPTVPFKIAGGRNELSRVWRN